MAGPSPQSKTLGIRAFLFPLSFIAVLGGYYFIFSQRKNIPFVTEGREARAEEARKSSEAFRERIQERYSESK